MKKKKTVNEVVASFNESLAMLDAIENITPKLKKLRSKEKILANNDYISMMYNNAASIESPEKQKEFYKEFFEANKTNSLFIQKILLDSLYGQRFSKIDECLPYDQYYKYLMENREEFYDFAFDKCKWILSNGGCSPQLNLNEFMKYMNIAFEENKEEMFNYVKKSKLHKLFIFFKLFNDKLTNEMYEYIIETINNMEQRGRTKYIRFINDSMEEFNSPYYEKLKAAACLDDMRS